MASVSDPGTIVVEGVRKTYEGYPTPGAEEGGILLWLGQARRALRLTSEPPHRVVALDGINLNVAHGEIVGLMGPNGAGKTTLIKILCGLVTPTAGTACVNGFDVVTEQAAVKRSISYVSTTGWMGLEWALTVSENLLLYARLFGLHGTTATQRVTDALAAVGLAEHASKHVYQLSSGMRQRAVIARGLLIRTPVLFLDEPTVGLDPVTARDLRRLIKEELNGRYGQTVIITSHFAPELDALCDRVGILAAGKLVTIGPPATLINHLHDRVVVDLQVSDLSEDRLAPLRATSGIYDLSATWQDADGTARLRLHVAAELPVDAVLDVLMHAGVRVRALTTSAPSLEDVFLALTGGALDG
jgi:ABC-2 type transport system ATP-binding protein